MCNFWPWGEPTFHCTNTMVKTLKTSHNFVHFPCVSVKNTYTMGICVYTLTLAMLIFYDGIIVETSSPKDTTSTM
jgi:hypothetical protein